MEIWLCRHNTYALIKKGKTADFFRIDAPTPVIDGTDPGRAPMDRFIRHYVTKHKMLRVLVNGDDLPDVGGSFALTDFDREYEVKVRSPAKGHKLLTFHGNANGRPCFVQLFARHHRGRNTTHIRVRETVDGFADEVHAPDGRPYLGYLIFEH